MSDNRMLRILAHSTLTHQKRDSDKVVMDLIMVTIMERAEPHITKSSTHQKRERNRVLVMSA